MRKTMAAAPDMMDVDADAEQRSQLFQVPLRSHDLLTYKKPATQAAVDPTNCILATTRVLGLITQNVAEKRSAPGSLPVANDDITRRINIGITDPSKQFNPQSRVLDARLMTWIGNALFTDSATLVGIHAPGKPLGHMHAIMKSDTGEVRVIDPQSGRCSGPTLAEQMGAIADMIVPGGAAAVAAGGSPPVTITLFGSNTFYTHDDYMNGYIDNPLAGLMGKLRVGGATRRRSSLPRRRAGRSSSVRRRRYTHRQQASRTGKGDYRSTKMGRKV